MARVRVLHVVVAGDIGGAERLLIDLATHAPDTDADHEVALFTPNPRLRGLLRDAGLTLHDRGHCRENPLAFLGRTLLPWEVAWLANVARQARADIVHTHTFASHVLGTRAALSAGLPQVRTEHHVQHYFDPSCSAFTRWAAHRTTQIVAISEYVRQVVLQTEPALSDRFVVVRNGVDDQRFAPIGPAPTEGPFVAVVVCRLEAWKQVHLAISAVAQVDGVRLDVVGDGSERQSLERLARTLGVEDRVRFLGYLPDPRPAIAAGHLCISASRDEPLGLSVLEALAMERPVIAFSGGGLPEIVRSAATDGAETPTGTEVPTDDADSPTGWLVTSRTAEALADAIRRARDDRSATARYGRAGRVFVQAEASVLRMCHGYREVYRSLARDRASRPLGH